MKRADYDKAVADLDKHVYVGRDNVNEAMCNQAELYAYYAILYGRSVRDCKLLEFQKEEIEAAEYRELASAKTRVTERQLQVRCHANSKWRDLRTALLEAEDCRDGLSSILRAMEHRKDMLVNYSATVRVEESLVDGVRAIRKDR